MGLLIGTGLGIGFGYWILDILQRNGDNYYSVPSIWVCLAGVALTVFFSLISNLIALHKIDKMRISDLKRKICMESGKQAAFAQRIWTWMGRMLRLSWKRQ